LYPPDTPQQTRFTQVQRLLVELCALFGCSAAPNAVRLTGTQGPRQAGSGDRAAGAHLLSGALVAGQGLATLVARGVEDIGVHATARGLQLPFQIQACIQHRRAFRTSFFGVGE
jgi:hypothetical protein